MSETLDPQAHIDLMARLMKLDVRPEWRASVAAHLVATAAAAELVMSAPLEDHIEPAPVFEP